MNYQIILSKSDFGEMQAKIAEYEQLRKNFEAEKLKHLIGALEEIKVQFKHCGYRATFNELFNDHIDPWKRLLTHYKT